MTLTNRLLLFYLATLAVVLGCFSMGLYLLVEHYLYGQLDERLESVVKTLSAAVEEGENHVEWEPGERHLDLRFVELGSSLAWKVGNERGETIAGSSEESLQEFIADTTPALRYDQSTPTAKAWQGRNWKASQRWMFANSVKSGEPIPNDPTADRQIQYAKAMSVTVGVSLSEVRRSQTQLALALAAISFAAWFLAFVSGRFLCRQALSPLTEMTNAMHAMSAGDLTSRLPSRTSNDEIRALSAAFNSLLDRLQVVFERQKAFTSDASHQLRTPLTAIFGQAEIALRKDRTNDEYREALRIVSVKAERLRKIVESLLFLARADSDAQIPAGEPLPVAQWMRDYLSTWASHSRAGDVQVTFSLPEDCKVTVQEVLLGEVLNILFDNACKYSDPGSRITVSALLNDNVVELSISNKGYVISEAEKQLLFQPFFRSSDSQKRGIEGIGLGLSIAKRLAAAMGAQLGVSYTSGEVFCATIRFQPLSPK